MGRKPVSMRSSNKSRSRHKNNNRRNTTNVINRVFDSSGPEGKVRGTPQQIVEKYQSLARDSQLNNDRVAAENFLQHSEHYSRLLAEAQREATARREQHEAQQGQRREAQPQHQNQNQQHQRPQENASNAHNEAQPDVIAPKEDAAANSGLVETPESNNARKPKAKTEKPKALKEKPIEKSDAEQSAAE